jgi:hypothetical protein
MLVHSSPLTAKPYRSCSAPQSSTQSTDASPRPLTFLVELLLVSQLRPPPSLSSCLGTPKSMRRQFVIPLYASRAVDNLESSASTWLSSSSGAHRDVASCRGDELDL